MVTLLSDQLLLFCLLSLTVLMFPILALDRLCAPFLSAIWALTGAWELNGSSHAFLTMILVLTMEIGLMVQVIYTSTLCIFLLYHMLFLVWHS